MIILLRFSTPLRCQFSVPISTIFVYGCITRFVLFIRCSSIFCMPLSDKFKCTEKCLKFKKKIEKKTHSHRKLYLKTYFFQWVLAREYSFRTDCNGRWMQFMLLLLMPLLLPKLLLSSFFSPRNCIEFTGRFFFRYFRENIRG